MSICIQCGKETKNPKFCCRSCAALRNNRKDIAPKRHPEGKCDECGCAISTRKKWCPTCREKKYAPDMTLQEAIYTKHHRSSAYALIRSRARSTEKFKSSKSCHVCGYDKHIEACHKKSISSFPPETLISEINSPENIIPLCRNCHWEYDHGIIDL